MSPLPSSKCISLFNDRILLYRPSMGLRNLEAYEIRDGVAKQIFTNMSYVEKTQKKYLDFVKVYDEWYIQHRLAETIFWKRADAKGVEIFRLTTEEYLLLLVDEI